MTGDDLARAAARVLERCRARGLTVATAESCTGGLVAGALTEIAGSSDVVDRGFVTYSDAAKQAMLGVPAAIRDRHGAVSRKTAEAMARGALAHAPVDLAVAITGIAGPGGGSAEKPVGSASCISPPPRGTDGSSIAKSGSATSGAARCGASR
jgi:nicotinamide-nucleotide amidase